MNLKSVRSKINLLDINSKSSKASLVLIRLLIFIPISYIILYPLFSMISTSLKTSLDVTDPAVVWIPNSLCFDNFKTAMIGLDYLKSLGNTALIFVLSALIEVVMCSVTAYGFARFNFRFKSFAMFLLVVNIIIPKEMIIVSSYIQMKYYDVFGILNLIGKLIGKEFRISLLDTPFSFWLPSFFSTGIKAGLFVFIYMFFFKNLPKELEEAAYIDGAGPIRTYCSIIVPSSGVVFLTICIFSLIWHWNEFYLPSVYLSSMQPLAVKLVNLESTLTQLGMNHSNSIIDGVVMAGCLLFILPMLLLYMVLQKYFVQSVDRVGIVG